MGEGSVMGVVSKIVRPIDSLKVVAKENGVTTDTVYTGTCTYDKDALSYSVTFSGLAVNEKKEKNKNPGGTTEILVEVYRNIKNPGKALGSFILNLEENYRGKNSIIINLDEANWPLNPPQP